MNDVVADPLFGVALQVALGSVVGFVVALLLFKYGKVLAIATVVLFAGFQVLSMYEFIDLSPVTDTLVRVSAPMMDGVEQTAKHIEGRLPKMSEILASNMYALGGAIVGFVVAAVIRKRKRSR